MVSCGSLLEDEDEVVDEHEDVDDAQVERERGKFSLEKRLASKAATLATSEDR